MHIKSPLLFLLAIVCTDLKAQLSDYYFSATPGTYTPITGTAVTFNILTNGTADEGTSGLLPIGFTFKYNGTDYTQLDACTNGFVQLGVAIDQAHGNITSNNLSATNYRNVLAPLWDDLVVGSPGGIRYETSGTAPNRVFTVQWSNVRWNYSSPNPVIEFQLKLYETTNRIEFIYNQLAAPVKSGVALIGININGSGSGSFLVLTDAGTAPGLNSDESYYYYTNKKPATGQVYAFFIPMPCSGTPTGGTTQTTNDFVCPSSNFKLSVAGATIAKNITYQWQSSADGITWQNIVGATDTNYTTQQTTDTYYRRAMTCSSNTAYSTSLQVKTGVLPITYATLPFTENFETTWLSNCAVRERPSLHFKNSVATGNRSWRREDDAAAGEWEGSGFGTWIGGNPSHAARFRVRDEFSAPVHSTGDLDLYIDCSPVGTKELRFKHLQTIGATALSVWYSIDGGVNFISLDTVMGWTSWKDQHFIIPSNSPNTIIRFRGQGAGYTGASDIGIDDIQVLVVTCNFPVGLTITSLQQTSATVSWNGEPGAEYEYRLTTAQEQPVGDVQLTADSQLNLSGLDPAKDYFLYIRRKCSEADSSSWSMLAFTPSADCGTAVTITCGSPYAFTVENGYGRYNLWLTDRENNCGGGGGYGKEKLLKFIPQVTGTYRLKVTALNVWYDVAWYIKDAAQGCGPVGWTCLGNTTSPTTFSMGNLIAGKEYYLLVDLATIGNGHNQTIEIECPVANPDCVTGAITPAGPVAICDGNSQLLQVSGGTAWQWFRDGASINGATSNTFTAMQSGKYSVAVTNGTCTKVSNTVTIESSNIAAPVVTITGNTGLCAGDSVLLSTSPVAGYTYQWQKDGTNISGATSATFTVTSTGLYTVTTEVNTCTSPASAGIQVTVHPIPAKPIITAGGPTTVCQGNTVVLTSSAATGNQWYKEGVAITGEQAYTASETGNYTVMTTQNGCSSEISSAITVTVKSLPPVPIITAGTGNTMISSAAAGNQWYKDGSLITGATGQTYAATASGQYTVQVILDGCTSTSAGFSFVVSGIVDPSTWNRQVIAYPNPVVKKLIVRNSHSRHLHLKLLDITGRAVYEGSLSNTTGIIEMDGIAAGVYQLLVTDIRKKETISLRIIKN